MRPNPKRLSDPTRLARQSVSQSGYSDCKKFSGRTFLRMRSSSYKVEPVRYDWVAMEFEQDETSDGSFEFAHDADHCLVFDHDVYLYYSSMLSYASCSNFELDCGLL